MLVPNSPCTRSAPARATRRGIQLPCPELFGTPSRTVVRHERIKMLPGPRVPPPILHAAQAKPKRAAQRKVETRQYSLSQPIPRTPLPGSPPPRFTFWSARYLVRGSAPAFPPGFDFSQESLGSALLIRGEQVPEFGASAMLPRASFETPAHGGKHCSSISQLTGGVEGSTPPVGSSSIRGLDARRV